MAIVAAREIDTAHTPLVGEGGRALYAVLPIFPAFLKSTETTGFSNDPIFEKPADDNALNTSTARDPQNHTDGATPCGDCHHYHCICSSDPDPEPDPLEERDTQEFGDQEEQTSSDFFNLDMTSPDQWPLARVLRQIENRVSWDPVGAAHALLSVDTENISQESVSKYADTASYLFTYLDKIDTAEARNLTNGLRQILGSSPDSASNAESIAAFSQTPSGFSNGPAPN